MIAQTQTSASSAYFLSLTEAQRKVQEEIRITCGDNFRYINSRLTYLREIGHKVGAG